MPDITMCSGEGCIKAGECYRHTAPEDKYQSYFGSPPFEERRGACFWRCDYFWYVKENKGDKR